MSNEIITAPSPPVHHRHPFNLTGALGYLLFAVIVLTLVALSVGVTATVAAGHFGTQKQAAPIANAGTTTAPAAAKDAVINTAGQPSATWQARDARLAPAIGGVEHKVTMEVLQKDVEVAPGVHQQMWTFNGTVPGPILRGKVGDMFTITLVNNGTLGHSLDFHASEVAPNIQMATILPGKTLVYQFVAHHSGIFMYHCGTAPALQHIAEGMYGAVVIDPPGLAPMAQEFVMVQSEFYFGPQGKAGDYNSMLSATPSAVLFNGYHNQYVHAPLKVHHGQPVRIWVMDVGPSENSAFHIVGTIFDTVYKEGAYTLRPGPDAGGSQVLDLQPAQGGFVEFTPAASGQYTFVTHKFSNVVKGAVGYIQAD